MTRICVEFLCFEDSWPVGDALIQKFERYERIDEVLDRDNYAEGLLVYAAEYWPSRLIFTAPFALNLP